MKNEILLAYWMTRDGKHWVRVFVASDHGEMVMWFETDDPTAWGTISPKLTDEQIFEWIMKFAARWGKHHGRKMYEQSVEERIAA